MPKRTERSVKPSADRWALGALLILLVWAPLPLASNRRWAVALLAMLCAGLLAVVLLARLLRWQPGEPEAAEHTVGWPWPAALLLGYAALVMLQLLPLPEGVRTLFAPGAQGAGPVSGDPFGTRLYLLACVAYTSTFLLVLLLVNSPARVRLLLFTLLMSGVLQSVLGVWLLSLGTSYEFLFTAFPLDGRAVGSFANPNHLAAYLQLTLAAGLGLLLMDAGRTGGGRRSLRRRVHAAIEFAMSPKMLVRLALVAMVIALVLTRSRGGNVAFFLGLLLTGAWVAWRCTRLRPMALVVVGSMVVVDLLVVGQWVGLDKVVQRLEATANQQALELARAQAASEGQGEVPAGAAQRAVRQEESLRDRLVAAHYALGMVWERPFLGFGGGTFHTTFSRFKGEVTLGQYDHAHNDYVEVAAETGIPGLVLLLLLVAATLRRVGGLVRDGTEPHRRGAAIGVLMALLCMAVHSMVDFNLHVPAVAMTFTALLALAWCGDRSKPRRRSRRHGVASAVSPVPAVP